MCRYNMIKVTTKYIPGIVSYNDRPVLYLIPDKRDREQDWANPLSPIYFHFLTNLKLFLNVINSNQIKLYI